jgi:D-threo-aldose 1-dehydrogenase
MPYMIRKRRLGNTSLELSELGYGCAAIGGMYRSVNRAEATEALTAAWEAGIRYFDTAPGYGVGISERIVGDFLRDIRSNDYVLSTKVGKLLKPAKSAATGPMPFEITFDYSYDGIMRSYEFSLARLGLARIDLLLVDDLDPQTLGLLEYRRHFPKFLDSGIKAMEELRSSGDIAAFGLGVSDVGACIDIMQRVKLDCLLINGRYTLLDRTVGTRVLGMCRQSATPLIVGSLFNSGTLVRPTGNMDEIDFIANRAREVAASAGVDIASAATQFPLRDELVTSAILGSARPSRIRAAIAGLSDTIPETVWTQFSSSAKN